MSVNTVHFKLTAAAPLHIGCGEVYEPMGFVIDHDASELVSFAPSDFLAGLSSDELASFSSICSRGTVESIQELYKFMHRHGDLARGSRVSVTSSFVAHHKEVLAKPPPTFKKEMNQFEIERTAFTPMDDRPYIPGSSIKGAIRTAILNGRNMGKDHPKYRGPSASAQLQENLLHYSMRDLAADPFRLVKVSDFFPVGTVNRKIIYAIDIKKKPTDKQPATLHQILEVVEPDTEFVGSITLLAAPPGIRQPVSLQEILDALQSFFGAEKEREDRELASIKVEPVRLNLQEGQTLPLRLGRHSGAECVTVRGHRNIRIKQGSKDFQFKKGATTIWLAATKRKVTPPDDLQPMGWVQLELLTPEQLQKINHEQGQMLAEQQERRKKEMAELVRQEEERKKQAEFEEARRLEEEKKAAEIQRRQAEEKQRWQAMSEGERFLACVREEDIALRYAENDARDPNQNIWPKLDSLPADDQKDLAKAFKERWLKEEKWNVKPKKKKQWAKVQKVKAILGEQ